MRIRTRALVFLVSMLYAGMGLYAFEPRTVVVDDSHYGSWSIDRVTKQHINKSVFNKFTCPEGCRIDLIVDGKNVATYGSFEVARHGFGTIFFDFEKFENSAILDKYNTSALVFLHHLAYDDLRSIALVSSPEREIGRLYYWFSRAYGELCDSAITDKSVMVVSNYSVTSVPFGASNVEKLSENSYIIEKSFIDRAIQYGEWYISGLVEREIREGLLSFIKEHECNSKAVVNVRENLLKFGAVHDEIWEKTDFWNM